MSNHRNREHSSQAVQKKSIPSAIENMARNLPGVQSPAERVTQIAEHHSSFEGPIPHPEIFKQYGEVVSDAPERILKVFEEDSRHAREIQSAALEAQKSDNQRVHWMAWSLIFGGYLLSALFAYWGKDWLAGIILSSTLVGTITGFLQGRKEEK